MSELLELQRKLQDTASTITELERALSVEPDSLGLRLSLESVVKRFDELQVEIGGPLFVEAVKTAETVR